MDFVARDEVGTATYARCVLFIIKRARELAYATLNGVVLSEIRAALSTTGSRVVFQIVALFAIVNTYTLLS